jgi:hypothetical protein
MAAAGVSSGPPPPGITWTARAAAPNTSSLFAATNAAATRIIAYPTGGTANLSTTDGLTWSSAGSAVAQMGNGYVFTFAGSFFFYSDGLDNLYTSAATSGTAWTLRLSGGGSLFGGVAYSPAVPIYVSPLNNGTFSTSTNGTSWGAFQALPTGMGNLYAIAYGAGRFVMVGAAGQGDAAWSTNGTTWTRTTSAPAYTANWVPRCFAFGGSQFVLLTTNGIYSSPDGVTWTRRSTFSGFAVAYGGGGFVVTENLSSRRTVTSPDGITWTINTTAFPAAGTWFATAYGASHMVALDNTSTATATSP